jgi:putative transcriptional regulator
MGEKIKNKINFYRIKNSYTQEELAALIGVSRQTIIAMEKGNYAPSIILALRFARVFRVPVEKIFSISE